MILNGRKIEAVIFDMDGVLIDSEPLWKIAEISTFQSVGVQLDATDLEKTVGLRIDEVVSHWYNHHPWKELTQAKVVEHIIQEMIRLIQEKGESLTGVEESLQFFKQNGVKIGLATSSYQVLLDTVLKKLEIVDYFDYTLSAEKLAFGKPHPEVYLLVANQLGVHPENCLVVEDSLNGVISGKAAKMMVVAVPEKSHTPDERLVLADYRVEDLIELIQLFS